MTTEMMLTLAAIALAAITFSVLERLASLRRKEQRFLRPYFASDVLFLLAGYLAIGRLALELAGVLEFRASTLPLWTEAIIALVLLDLGLYASHLALHRHDALWKIHQVHHSLRALDWLATFHSHPLEQALRRSIALAIPLAAGLSAQSIGVAGAILVFWAILNHANLSLNLRKLEPLLITPRLHHLHHLARTGPRNLGTLFSVWDRLFDTFESSEPQADEELGLGREGAGENYPRAFFPALARPFRRASTA